MKSELRSHSEFRCLGVWSWPSDTQTHSPPTLGSACCLHSLATFSVLLGPSSVLPQNAPLIQAFGALFPLTMALSARAPSSAQFHGSLNFQVSILGPPLTQCKEF